MRKTIGISIVVLVVLAAVFGIGVFKFEIGNTPIVNVGATDAKNASYLINNQPIVLKNGVSEISAAPGSASKIITRYFGNEVRHDFDGDGREDVAFLLTQETGGSGTFYYVVAAINKASGYVGSDAVLLGDRVAPQTTHMGNGNVIVVNYAVRNPGEPFTTRPSLGKSIWLLLDTKTMQFGEVAQNFEGEADPARMTLGMKTWNWTSTTYNNDTEVRPRDSNRFSITFKKDGTFSVTTDCNSMGGKYMVSSNKITLSQMMSTMMYCEGSQEGEFSKMLGEVQSYLFTSRGELIFSFKFDSGTMVFR